MRKKALVLTGGGARAAYQVGALKAIAEITRFTKNPFQIITGYSAGAINALWLASRSENFDVATQLMWEEWAQLHTKRIYKTNPISLMGIGLKWLRDRGLGGMTTTEAKQINYLLDTSPLHDFIKENIRFQTIHEHIRAHRLYGVSVTAVNYNTGMSTTFFSGHPEIPSWKRNNRISIREEITTEHVMASAAIPIFFPPIKLGTHFYGDGMVRLHSPLSSAIHMGAESLLVIGTPKLNVYESESANPKCITISEIAGTVLNGLFFDSLELDVERMERVNRALKALTPEEKIRQPDRLRYIDLMWLKSSRFIHDLPRSQIDHLPATLRFFLKGNGISQEKGSDMLSYLSFEPEFIKALLELGYQDTLAQREKILAFFGEWGHWGPEEEFITSIGTEASL